MEHNSFFKQCLIVLCVSFPFLANVSYFCPWLWLSFVARKWRTFLSWEGCLELYHYASEGRSQNAHPGCQGGHFCPRPWWHYSQKGHGEVLNAYLQKLNWLLIHVIIFCRLRFLYIKMMVNCIDSSQVNWSVTNNEQTDCSYKGKDATVSFHIFCAH